MSAPGGVSFNDDESVAEFTRRSMENVAFAPHHFKRPLDTSCLVHFWRFWLPSVTAVANINTPESTVRMHVEIRGAVQGVGFRPFVYRLATELGLPGWVINSAQGVFIEVEAPLAQLTIFHDRLVSEIPPRAQIHHIATSYLAPEGFTAFEIRKSHDTGVKTAVVLPDIATCPDCLRELLDPSDRRYRYPFTNCTNCGPRFTIIEELPYDRPNTTMRIFPMCEACRAEYEDPLNRRFHAQPNACPVCGPHMEIWSHGGQQLAAGYEVFRLAAQALCEGRIVALKGIGGFHLVVDARNDEAVRRLRARKHREEKPFAVMFPSIEALRRQCEVSELEEKLLESPEAPIVLLRTLKIAGLVSSSVAPGNPNLGAMLPYSPIHHLLMREIDFPVVATSGNLSDEPICTDEKEALTRLGEIADLFAVHNRPIARHVDDSVARIIGKGPVLMRRARGFAPMPVQIQEGVPTLLSTGAHLKNTVAVSRGPSVFISQHIGDLETLEALRSFQAVAHDLQALYDLDPDAIACDLHPDYLSSQHARKSGKPVIPVQHHYAHILACMAEHGLEAPVFGVSWDGTGYGTDGTIWGGEFLLVNETGFDRIGHLRTFCLPGGDKAVKQPRRTALGLLFEIFGSDVLKSPEVSGLALASRADAPAIISMLQKRLNAPVTSSAGRLFDAIAAIAGGRQDIAFEGQAAMQLEFALSGRPTRDEYVIDLKDVGAGFVADWEPCVRQVLSDVAAGADLSYISYRFHNAMAGLVVSAAHRAKVENVAVSGGCFQNRYLLEQCIERLTEAGFRPHWPQRIPPNDNGISVGQIMAAAREMKRRST